MPSMATEPTLAEDATEIGETGEIGEVVV